MGLDFYIEAKVKSKKDETTSLLELGYWRKCYEIRNAIVKLAEKYRIKDDENYKDITFICSHNVLKEIITVLLDEIPEFNSKMWQDSIWGETITRDITLKELRTLLGFNDWLEKRVSSEDLFDANLIEYDRFSQFPLPSFYSPDDYEVTIRIINSY